MRIGEQGQASNYSHENKRFDDHISGLYLVSFARWLFGVWTLAVRLDRAQSNARMLAERLSHHPNVTLTRYPGLASHPTHEAARRQLKDFGTVISFDVRGDAADAEAVRTGLRLVP